MKLKKMTVALSAALAAYAGAASAADVTVFMSGASALRNTMTRLLALYCKTAAPAPAEFQLSPAPAGTSSQDFRNYQCTFKTAADPGFRPELTTFGLAGHTASIYHSVGQTLQLGGSITGVTPIVRPINLNFVNDASVCAPAGVDAVTGFALNNCNGTISQRPNIGVSDDEPTLFSGANLPSFAPYNVAAFPAQPGDDHISVNTLFVEGFGVALTKKLHDGLIGGVAVTNLTHQQVSGLLNGAYDNWSQLGGPNAPITLITRTKGSGTKAFFNAAFLENPCGANAAPADTTSSGPTGTLTVHEWDATGDLRNDLVAVDNAGGAGVAIIGLDSNSGNGLEGVPGPGGWTYATIDGQSVYVSNVALDVADGSADHILEDQIINGNWKYFSEATLQFRDAGANALTGLNLAFAQMIAQNSNDPTITKQLPGVVSTTAWSNNFPNPRVVSGGVSNFTRGGDTCAPGIFSLF
jgi:hypothetical protein